MKSYRLTVDEDILEATVVKQFVSVLQNRLAE